MISLEILISVVIDKLTLPDNFLVSVAAATSDTYVSVEITLPPLFNGDDLGLRNRLEVLLREIFALGCVYKIPSRPKTILKRHSLDTSRL